MVRPRARLRIPIHVGELAAGILIGPTFFARIWPGAVENLLAPTSRALIDVFSWIGIIFLVLIGGLETRLGLARRARWAVVGGWLGGFGLPFGAGYLFGMLFPAELIPPNVERPVFALFIATAMSISAIPVIARILMDLDLLQTRVGTVILSSAIADDTVGWITLSIAAGLAGTGVATAGLARTILLTIAFVVVAFTFGKRLVRKLMTVTSDRMRTPFPQVSMMFLLVFGFGAITQAIGVHLVLGAFVAAILIGRIRRLDSQAVAAVRQVGMGFFVPIFFAYTGTKVDLGSLGGSALIVTVIAVLIACVTKIVGGGLGALAGGMRGWEAVAVGIGLNARGAMELVIAAIGLSIGLLNEATYAMVVLIAVITTMMTSPLLQWSVSKAHLTDVPLKRRRERSLASQL